MASVTTTVDPDTALTEPSVPTTTTTAADAVTTTTTTSIPQTSAAPATTTTTLPPSTSVISVEPSTIYEPAPNPDTPLPTTVVTQITSVITQTPTNPVETQGPIITTITSTQPVVTYTPSISAPSSTSKTSSSASQSVLNPTGQTSSQSNGLGSGATIAIAVIIPIVALVALVLFGIWFWRRRKAKKNAEEMRKIENADYTFNPNIDPTLPVGGAAYADGGSEGNDDSGYRGWGATSTLNRKTSTTLGSNSRGAVGGGQGLSDAGSQPGGYNSQPSPSAGGASDDPLIHGYEGSAGAGGATSAAASGALAGGIRSRNSQNSRGIHRGISNASSAYSAAAPPSDASSDTPEMPRPYYQEEIPYNVYNENQHGQGAYPDNTYNGVGEEPIIRDVQARRNTRIERAPTFPQQGGIAQNF